MQIRRIDTDMKPFLHFSHANGLPTATYQLLLDHLSPFYRLSSLPVLGHDPTYPVTDNWSNLKQQLIHSIESNNDAPVIGVGHSMGGALTLMAAQERPDLFRGVIMLDVPTFSRAESWLLAAAKKTGFIDRLTPAHRSRNRRTHWPSREEAIAYFRQKTLFAGFHPQCLQDYVAHGLQDDELGGVTLGYRLDVELAVFRTVPHTLVLSAAQLKTPVGILVGQQTDTVRPGQYRRMKRTLGFVGKRVSGSHMFPLERPQETARDIHQLIQRMGLN